MGPARLGHTGGRHEIAQRMQSRWAIDLMGIGNY